MHGFGARVLAYRKRFARACARRAAAGKKSKRVRGGD
jgi:hypothetical protein